MTIYAIYDSRYGYMTTDLKYMTVDLKYMSTGLEHMIDILKCMPVDVTTCLEYIIICDNEFWIFEKCNNAEYKLYISIDII